MLAGGAGLILRTVQEALALQGEQPGLRRALLLDGLGILLVQALILQSPPRTRPLKIFGPIGLTDFVQERVLPVSSAPSTFDLEVEEDDNIALADPGLPMEAVIQAAQLAGAHEFILEMPEGYDTLVGEHGASLSGGQRQRIAIARALVTKPRILIFDEATSALDYESERIIQQNMQAICQNRTVIIIAHRLSTVRAARRILVMDKGQIVEQGSHAALVEQEGLYHDLYERQFIAWENGSSPSEEPSNGR